MSIAVLYLACHNSDTNLPTGKWVALSFRVASPESRTSFLDPQLLVSYQGLIIRGLGSGHRQFRFGVCGPGRFDDVPVARRGHLGFCSSIGTAPMRFAPLIATNGAICGFLFGCSPAAMGPSTFFADPGKYDYHNCEQLAEQRKIAADRELELKLLIDKAERAAGGTAVSVIAYQGDYIMAREELKVIDATARAKHCR
jgi:hypothetical protein